VGGASSSVRLGSARSSLLTLSLRSLELDESVRRCDGADGDAGGDMSFLTGFTNLNTCTVSDADETHNRVEVALNDMW
jgi:hypothetical protein